MAVEAGMIGFTTTSTGPATVAAYGSRSPGTANNAVAWGVPTRSGAPFVLDMACGVSAWGKVESLKMYGRQLPEGWALDASGSLTLDPASAKTLLPFAGARGYGMAFLSSVLAGALVGGRMPMHKTTYVSTEGSEHFFYAIDIKQFVDLDRFYGELESTMAEIRALPPAEGFDRVRLPGELEWERSHRWKREGIPLHRDHVKKLEELAVGSQVDRSLASRVIVQGGVSTTLLVWQAASLPGDVILRKGRLAACPTVDLITRRYALRSRIGPRTSCPTSDRRSVRRPTEKSAFITGPHRCICSLWRSAPCWQAISSSG